MTKKHILIVSSTFPTSSTDPVPAFVKDQIIALKAVDPELKFSVLAPHDKRSNTRSFSKHANYDEYRFHYFWPFALEKLAGRGIMPALKSNPLNYLLIPFLFSGEFLALLCLTIKLKPNLIYAHWFTPQAINARLVSSITKLPFVFTTHAADVDVWHKVPLIGKYIVRGNTRRAKAFTAVSRRSMAKLERFFSVKEWNQLKQRSAIIPMGVNLPKITQSRDSANGSKNILFIGRLAEKKGVQYLLPAYAAIKNQLNDAKLIVAGDGPWLQRLQQQAVELGIAKSVTFPGFISGSPKESIINQADIYVVPSIITTNGDAEGLPVSLMEGLAHGKICIATNESGADDIITDGKDGFLVPQKNQQALETALIQVVGLTTKQSDTITQAAMVTARQFSWPEIAKRHDKFLFN